ncbi:MAG TPA: nitroreductase family protein [Nitrolancea sp.]|nr:nitroreductase family protein [Nitrolancea sp.]
MDKSTTVDGTEGYRPIPLEFERLPLDVSRKRSRDFLETIRKRRSIRSFSSEPVPFDLIENAIAAAGAAPSGANQQPWTFVVVTDPDLKRQIREAAETEEQSFYDHRISDEWRTALVSLGTDAIKTHLTDAPYIVVVFEQPFGLKIGADGKEQRVKHYYAQESVGIAVGLFLASITEAGLCALTHTPSPMNFLRTLLKRPRNERPFVVLPVGYPAKDATVPAHALEKKSLDQIMVRM